MSIFSAIKKSHARAQEHKADLAQQKKKEQAAQRTPYRHVPTHAATDAFLSAPPSWRTEDHARIVDINHRRSAMAHAGYNMNIPGTPASLPRVSSGLSYVAYPNGSDVPPIPSPMAHPMTRHQPPTRAYSYAAPSAFLDQPRDSHFSVTPLGSTPDLSLGQSSNSKAKELTLMGTQHRYSHRTSSKGSSPAAFRRSLPISY
jgi:hypothetical protein